MVTTTVVGGRPVLPAVIRETRVVAILRGLPTPAVVPAARSLFEAGVRAMEVTLDSPDALRSIAAVAEALSGVVAVGAGTVLTDAAARDAVAAGASFLVTPVTDPGVIGGAAGHGVPVVAGALSPTEIHAAWGAGAAAVKLFPAGAVGPRYLREVRGPLGHVPIVPTGGVTAGDAAEWLSAGAAAVGVGGWLVAGGDCRAIRSRAAELFSSIARQEPSA